jgi:hypothetical protein
MNIGVEGAEGAEGAEGGDEGVLQLKQISLMSSPKKRLKEALAQDAYFEKEVSSGGVEE